MNNRRNVPTIKEIVSTTLWGYIQSHMRWSEETFGGGDHLEGLLKHIEKEIQEVRQAATPEERLRELVDIIILVIDAMWRQSFLVDEITSALIEKQNINMERSWPKITDQNEPTEHIK